MNKHKITLARKLVDVLSPKEQRLSDLDTVFQIIKEDGMDVDEDFIKSYKEIYDFNYLSEKIAEIYVKYFTDDELIDFINFFSSKIGQKWISKYPSITKDIIDFSSEYGGFIADQINKDDK